MNKDGALVEFVLCRPRSNMEEWKCCYFHSQNLCYMEIEWSVSRPSHLALAGTIASSILLSKNMMIEAEYFMYISMFSQKSVPLPAVVYQCEFWFLKFKTSPKEGTQFGSSTVLSFIF